MKNKRNFIIFLRMEKGLKQYELAEKLCISRVYLSRIERGDTPLTFQVMTGISEVLAADIGYIAKEETKYLQRVKKKEDNL